MSGGAGAHGPSCAASSTGVPDRHGGHDTKGATRRVAGGKQLRVVSDAAGKFVARLPRGSSAANIRVYAEGYVRAALAHTAGPTPVTLALGRARPAAPTRSPISPPAGTYGAVAQALRLQPQARLAQALGGGGSFFAASGSTTSPGCGTCSPIAGASCCACAAGCPLQGTCGGLPPPPAVGAPFPSGCSCVPSSCPGYTAGGSSSGGSSSSSGSGGGSSSSAAAPPAPVPDPPPPASSNFNSWAVGDANVYFNYIGGCLSFADGSGPASANSADIDFYLTAYPAGSTPAAALPLPMLYKTAVGAAPLDFIDTCAAPPRSDPLRSTSLTACSFCDAAHAAQEAPLGCQLSDGSTRPVTHSCATLDTTLAYGRLPSGRACSCKWQGAACNYATDQCCFDAAHDVCCNFADPSTLLVCLDGVCVPASPSGATQ